MKSSTLMEFAFPDGKSAEAAARALSHEGSVSERSSSTIGQKDNILRIEIEAHDVVALRATSNAFLRALQVIEEVQK
jgi:tRNA threonylcarbamoyladenosine modification (KEOPS) complex  Pcc1 subunit